MKLTELMTDHDKSAIQLKTELIVYVVTDDKDDEFEEQNVTYLSQIIDVRNYQQL